GVGACTGGTEYCSAGIWGPTCVGEVLPRTETCDGADNDCDIGIDEDFNFDSDLNYCGSCTNSCLTNRPSNSYPINCSAGTCQYACSYGYHDINLDLNTLGMAGDGCEYACEPSASTGIEFCDGIDNDCDGATDEVADLVAPPAGYCRTGGGCGLTVTTTCQIFDGSKQWVCNYPAAVERIANSPNLVKGFETLCDNLDGDCDGNPDDDFYPVKGSACLDTNLGICQGSGTYACKSDHTGTECVITTPGAPPSSELCDNIDNDCDGLVDEPAWNPGSNASYVNDSLATITVGGQSVFMFKYEASRPTATAASAGTGSELRACSKAGVIPWSRVTFEQAQQACRAAGMDLCEENVWEEGCDGSAVTRVYPYGNTYNASTCWGTDTGVTTAQATNSKPGCTSSGYAVLDMSGNLREWVRSLIAYSEEGKAIYQTRGGSFRDGSEALKCAHDTVALTEDAFSNNVGFRCCTRCGNGVVDADEICDDGNRVSGDGCSAVCGPDTCGNGMLQGLEECDCGRDPDALPANCIAINGAANANCSLNCTVPEELCSILYQEDQDRGAESSDCTDPFCNGTRCGDVTDNDGDGFTEPDDCNDNNALINPAMDENCATAYDDNCNGFINGAEPDKDGDGILRCVGAVTTDCDDWDPARYPGKPEICGNGIDENCDGSDLISCATACQIAEYERSYLGCEYFAITTMNDQLSNTFNSNFVLSVFNRNATPTTVTITKAGANVQTETIAANSYFAFYLAFDTTLKNGISSILNRAGGAYIVTSTQPVAVYQFNPFDFYIGTEFTYTNDASLLLPRHVMTKSYMVTSSPTLAALRPGFFAVAATSNGTTISVYFNGNAPGQAKGTTRTYNLNRGDVLQVPSSMSCTYSLYYCSNDYDLTGSTVTVTAGDPVAVFAGHNCQIIPDGYGYCDHMEEQMMPLETWGKNFIATITNPYNGTTASSNMFRILASEASTVVTFTPAVRGVANLNAGQYVDVTTNQNFTISSTKPIMVTQYLLGQSYFSGANEGDPAMGTLVPTEQFRTSYSFSVPSSITHNYVNIVKPVALAGRNAPVIYFDGVALSEALFSTAIGSSYHGVYRRNISTSPYTHTITSSQPFGIMVYGYATTTSYMYPGGLDLNIINIVE
ncbi:SUMF1/EgtB/PvdO family nonheme iron enzyme, partial [Myxococcota bacterium]|nr:SUMF1/EgtB/PvdO family nonheme iron enzyme [Myxococcota bacterium]